MKDNYFNNFFNSWDIKEETVFSKKIILEDREICPLDQITIFYKKTGEIASASTSPIAWFIKEKNDYYAILFDEEKEEIFWEKLEEYKLRYKVQE